MLLGLLAVLTVVSTLPQREDAGKIASDFDATLQLRIALGAYQLSSLAGPPEVASLEALLGPKRSGALGLQRALVAREVAGLDPAIAALPKDPDLRGSSAWLTDHWRQQTSAEAPDEFAQHAGPFVALTRTQAERERFLVNAQITALIASLTILSALIATGIGCILGILAIRAGYAGRLRFSHAHIPWHHGALLAAFTIYLVSFNLYGGLLPDMAFEYRVLATWGFLAFLPLAFLPLQRWALWSWQTIAQALGCHRGQGVWREIGAGLVGYVVGLPVLGLGFLLTSLLADFAPVSHPVAEFMQDGHLAWTSALAMAAVACVFAPLIEELTFRGMLVQHLRGRMGSLVAILVSALIFAAVHPQGLAGIPVLMAMGAVLAAIRCWRGSLIGSVAAHMLHNGILITLLVAFAKLT